MLHSFTLTEKNTPEAQRAWREKMGLISIILSLMAIVGFITFGFTQTVCDAGGSRIDVRKITAQNLVVNGVSFDLGNWNHPPAEPYFNGTGNPLYSETWQAGGKDASFLFQKVNENCQGIITPAPNSAIATDGDRMGWYFPCNLHGVQSEVPVDKTGYDNATTCHTSGKARDALATMRNDKESRNVYYNWNEVKNISRNLAVYEK